MNGTIVNHLIYLLQEICSVEHVVSGPPSNVAVERDLEKVGYVILELYLLKVLDSTIRDLDLCW